jgi:hypothetical protein
MLLRIDPGGTVHCLYSEVINLAVLGSLLIARASHVEPDAAGAWWADLSPVGGPTLGPFDRRSDALTAERAWLELHWLVVAVASQAQRGQGTCPSPTMS